MIFIIRVDDIQSRNISALPRSIKPFESAVNQRGGKVTWAVIPHRFVENQNIDGILSKELRESLNYGNEIAMHGYNHICTSCGQSSHEMFCTQNNYHFNLTQQKQFLQDGLNVLYDTLGIIPVSFIPPGHSQDTTTFEALVQKGFRYLSSNGETKQFIHKTLFNVKQHSEYTWQLTSTGYQTALYNALTNIRSSAKTDGYYCLLLHDPFIRQGYENGLVVKWIEELLDSLNTEYNEKIKYMTLKDASVYFQDQLAEIADQPWEHELILLQNYPNPFNPSTVIEYSLPSSLVAERGKSYDGINVSLIVYDILGNEIQTLVNDVQTPGLYRKNFNSKTQLGRELYAGVYIYVLHAGSIIRTGKMLILK